MAVTVLFRATRSADHKSLSIQDTGTAWTTAGDMDKANVSGISLKIFGQDKISPLKEITFTSGERIAYLAGSVVTFNFSDARLYNPSLFSPDGFFLAQLHVTGGVVIETQTAFDSHYYITNIVTDKLTSINLPITTFYEANRQVTGDSICLWELERLSSTLTVQKEISWRKVYNFLAYNHNA